MGLRFIYTGKPYDVCVLPRKIRLAWIRRNSYPLIAAEIPETMSTSHPPPGKKPARKSSIFNILAQYRHHLAEVYYFFGIVSFAVGVILWLLGKVKWTDSTTYLAIGVGMAVTLPFLAKLVATILDHDSGSQSVGHVINNILDADYRRGDIKKLVWGQFYLRIVLVCFIFGGVIHSMLKAVHGSSSYNNSLIVVLTRIHLFLGILYLIGTIYFQRRAIRKISDPSPDEKTNILWPAAKFDWLFITLMWCSAFQALSEFHLAYCIPLLGAWLFSRAERAGQLLCLIFVGVTLRSAALLAFASLSPSFRATNAIEGLALLQFIPASFIAPLCFWAAISLPIALLRTLRTKEQQQRQAAEQHSQMLHTIGEHIVYSLFRKDHLRRFEYVNGPMLKRLGKERDEVIGRTDKQLDIERDEYKNSDQSVLDAPSAEAAFFEGWEANFDRSPGATELIYTTKKGIIDPETGKPIGLVGLCEPGPPLHLAKMTEQLMNAMPYYVICKDQDGHMRWASPSYCKGVGMTLKTLLAQRNEHGATDYTFYPAHVAEKYRADDAAVLSLAKAAVADGEDPMLRASVTKIEMHYFPPATRGRWVTVRKTPWLSTDGKRVLGVQVYFHDIHESFCRQGMIGRWLRTHLQQAVHALGRPHRRDGQRDTDKTALSDLHLFALELHIIQWLRTLIEGDAPFICTETFLFREIRWLCEPLQNLYRGISLKFSWDDTDCPVVGDPNIIEALIMVFVMNANESSIKGDYDRKNTKLFHRSEGVSSDTRPNVTIELSCKKGSLRIRVVDEGAGFVKQRGEAIMRGEALNEDGLPGSGIFLARYLAQVCNGQLNVSSAGGKCGAVAEFVCRIEDFANAAERGARLNKRESDAFNIGADAVDAE